MPDDPQTNPVIAAITSRRSVRAFLPTPVPRPVVEAILLAGARAPSGTNTQPWKVHVVTGAPKERLSAAIVDAFDNEPGQHKAEFEYYMHEWREPYLSRRRKVGWDMYGLVGIGKGDKEKAHAQHARNYVFFDAPVGMIMTIERDMQRGSWLDLGGFLQTLMIAARGFGLDTCPQAAFSHYHKVIRRHLPIPENEIVAVGLSLGHADPDAPINRLVTVREPLEVFAQFHTE